MAGPIIAALLLAPAAVILALYPLNGILGTVGFYTASIPLHPWKFFLIVPILLGFVLVWRGKDWLLAAMLVPGIVLVLFGPDRIGSHHPVQGDSKAFYPDRYDAADVTKRIDNVAHSIRDAGRWLALSPLDPSALENIRWLQAAADKSVAAWKDRTTVNAQKAALEKQLTEANARKAALGGRPGPRINLVPSPFNIRRHLDFGDRDRWDAATARVNGEINALTGQINKLSAGAGGDLYPAAVSATAKLKVELDLLERLVAEDVSFAKALPYVVAASLSFMLFMFVVGFMNPAMAGLVLATAAACLWAAWPLSPDDWQIDLLLILYPAFICALSAFVLRFAYRAYLDNAELAGKFEVRRLARAAAVAALLWLPFPAVVVGAVMLNNVLYEAASSAIYCEGKRNFCGSLGFEPPVENSDPSRDTLRDDINAAIQRLIVRFEAEAVRGAEAAKSGVADQVNAANARVMAIFDRVLPADIYHENLFPDLRPPDCEWYQIKCIVIRSALRRLNAAYQAPRNRLRARLATTLADVGAKIIAKTTNIAIGFEDAIKGESQQAILHATKTVDATFVGFNVLSVLQMALMLIVSMRAFLLIFGRMLYRDDQRRSKSKRGAPVEFPRLALTHSEGQRSRQRVAVTAYPEEFELVGDKYLPLLTKRLANLDDADQATLLLQARYTTWPIRRIINGCLVLTEVRRSPGKKSIRFSTIGGRQLVVWTIPEGTEVFFRWDRFVAMTAGMEIRKSVSLRIGGLATGTTMHASVIGPGLLIQESRGRVELTQEEDNPGSVFPGRLMSWESGARFQIRSPKRWASVYFDPPSLEVERGPRAVSDSGGGWRRGLGVLRELVRLFRP